MSTSSLYRGILGLAAATLMTPVLAQEDISFIEEIVVTSTKMQSTLQAVPVAVSVVSAEDIKEAQVLDIKDLQFMVPSLRVGQLQSSGNTNFFIRGFGNGANNAGIEPSVGVFIDGVYRSRSAAALNDLPNLERVEVLRGPQSTLFGKNASAGVISVITAKPSLDETTGSVSVTAGDYNQIIVKGDVSGPLSDTVGFGLSASYNQRDGYYDDLVNGEALGELNRYNVRGELLFLPSDSLEVRVIADYSDLDEACCGVANLVDGPTGGAIRAPSVGGNLVSNAPFAYEGYYNYTPINQFESSGVSVQFDYDFNEDLTLTSITSFRNLARFDDVDSDFTSADLIDIGNQVDLDIDTITQELRLAGTTESLSWMVGGFFFDESIEQRSEVTYGTDFRAYGDILAGGGITALETALGLPTGILEGAGQGLLELSTMDDQAISIFAQVDIDLGDRATLTLGANYTEDEKDVTFDSTATDVFSSLDMVQIGFGGAFAQITGLPPTPANIAANPAAAGAAQAISVTPCTNPPTGPCNPSLALQPLQFLRPNIDFPNSVETGMTKDDATTWTVRLAFDATDDVNIYVSAGTGFKASSWNLSRDSRPFASDMAALGTAGLLVPNIFSGTRFASPEDSTVYEIGLKGQWDTIALNLAIFDQEIDGFQNNIFTGVGFSLANAGTQSTTGAEMDIRWAPTESFEASFAATYLDPLYDSFPGAEGVNGPTDLSGTVPPGISELSIVTAGTYRFTLGNASAFIRGEYIYESEVQVIENVPESDATREVSTFNASFGLAWDNGFEAMLWGRNITNDEYLVQAFPSVAQNSPCCSYSGYPNQPATYGVTLRKYFD
jgi:iron complex outermembrane receptor protein